MCVIDNNNTIEFYFRKQILPNEQFIKRQIELSGKEFGSLMGAIYRPLFATGLFFCW